jgi:general secretion pathway protein D
MWKNCKLPALPRIPTLVKLIWVVGLSLGLAHCVLAEQEAQIQAPQRTRVFSLKYVPSQKVKEYLVKLKIGDTISQLPVNNALIVTAPAPDLIKATSIVKLVDVDSEDEFVIKALAQGPDAMKRPSNQQIAQLLGDISIGTFLDPPTSAPAAILDIHNDALVLLAPKQQLNRISQAIEQLQTAAATDIKREEQPQPEVLTTPLPEEPNQYPPTEMAKQPETEEHQAGTDLNELFDKLLDSLAEAEKAAAQEASEMIKLPGEPEQQPGPTPTQQAQREAETTAALPKQAPEERAVDLEEATEPYVQPQQIPTETIPPLVEELVIPNGEEELKLDLPEKVDIIALLDLVGKYLDLDYLYDPVRIRGDVTLKVQGPLKVKDLYALLESVLKFKGFAMSRKGNLVTIVPIGEVLDVDPTLQVDGEAFKPGDVVITSIFNLGYINTNTAATLLRGMKLGTNITELPDTGQLIVTEFAYRMNRIEQLLELVDQPGEPRMFKFRQLKYTLVGMLTPKIKTLAEQLGTISISVATAPTPAARRSRRGRRPSPAPTTTGTTQKPSVYLDYDERTNRILMVGLSAEIKLVNELIDAFDIPQQDLRIIKEYEIQYADAREVLDTLETLGIGKTDRPKQPPRRGEGATATVQVAGGEAQFHVLELTNSILVNATPEWHATIAMIISYVDREPAKVVMPYEIYPLENQDPKAMAQVLNELVEKTTRDKEGKVQTRVKEEDITIVADENTFSIIVYASKKNQEWIGKLIKSLDKRRPQVLIDVTLVEVDKTDAFEYDLNIVANARHAVVANAGTGLTALASSITDSLELGFNPASAYSGETRGFYSSKHIQALITAIEEKSYGRVLARPKVLVNDNEEGRIITSATTNVTIKGSSTTNDTIVYTETFQPYTADIELIITPHISEGDLLRLEVSMKREDFDPDTLGGATPPDQTRSGINTTVTVPDGKTIILGGLIKLTQAKGGEKVPLLGDIPLVGALFRNVNNTNESSKLYIFVKANILRPGTDLMGLEQLEDISQRHRDAFERSEREFQDYRNLPGFPADRVDPLNVLEEE